MNFVSQMISNCRVYFDYVLAFVSINHIHVNHYPSLTESDNSSVLEMNADFNKVILTLVRMTMKRKKHYNYSRTIRTPKDLEKAPQPVALM
jgi:hypothetical protein